MKNYNCTICAQEFTDEESSDVSLNKINISKCKICKKCFDNSDPAEDYMQVKQLLAYYRDFLDLRNIKIQLRKINKSKSTVATTPTT